MSSTKTPKCNRSNVIEDNIKSVIEQSFTNSELIIVDYEFTDNKEELFEKYLTNPNIRHLKK